MNHLMATHSIYKLYFKPVKASLMWNKAFYWSIKFHPINGRTVQSRGKPRNYSRLIAEPQTLLEWVELATMVLSFDTELERRGLISLWPSFSNILNKKIGYVSLHLLKNFECLVIILVNGVEALFHLTGKWYGTW